MLAAVNLRPGITSFAPLIERIATDLQLSRGLISLTTALPVLLMGLLAPLAPRLAVRLGLERAITCCLALIGLALSLRLFGLEAWVLIGSAGLLGAGVAVAGPLLSGFIKRHFSQRMGPMGAWYSLSMTIGGTAGVVLTAPLNDWLGGRWHWALAFWMVPAVLAVAVWTRVPSQPEAAGQQRAGQPEHGAERQPHQRIAQQRAADGARGRHAGQAHWHDGEELQGDQQGLHGGASARQAGSKPCRLAWPTSTSSSRSRGRPRWRASSRRMTPPWPITRTRPWRKRATSRCMAASVRASKATSGSPNGGVCP